MDTTTLSILQLSPGAWILLLAGGLFIGTLVLMGVVRLTEGFAISFWTAAKITCVSLVAVIALQSVVTLTMMQFKLPQNVFVWTSSLVALIGSLFVCIWIYAAWVKSPAGKPIGMARAIKVTLVQTGLQVAVIIALAVAVAVLVANGVIDLPALPT